MKKGLATATCVACAGAALYAGLLTSINREARPRLESGQVNYPTATPTSPNVSDSSVRARTIDVVTLPITTFIQNATLIAKIHVDLIGPAFFNTASGTAPAIPLAVDDPLQDDDPGWKIQRLAVLDPVTVFKGDTTSTKYVTMIQGGRVGDHIWDVGGLTVSRLEQNDTAIVFVLGGIFDGAISVTSDVPWISQAALKIQALNQAGEVARFIVPEGMIRYTDLEHAVSEEIGAEMQVADVESIIVSVLSNPTPTPTP